MNLFNKFKRSPPGQKPGPDNQGKSNTCTRYGLAKAIAGFFHLQICGDFLDLKQAEITAALVNKNKDVAGRWPTDFNKETILVKDHHSDEFYTVDIRVSECSFQELQQNWGKSQFVVVYDETEGLHCIYVDKAENDQLVCINSYGKNDQYPQLDPNQVHQIYKVDATATLAPENEKDQTKTPKTKRTSISESHMTVANRAVWMEAEIARLKAENEQLRKEQELLAVMENKNKENDHFQKSKKFHFSKEKESLCKRSVHWFKKKILHWDKDKKDNQAA